MCFLLQVVSIPVYEWKCVYTREMENLSLLSLTCQKCSQRISKNLSGETSLVKYGVTVMYAFVQVHCRG
jgi:hypothetical protein